MASNEIIVKVRLQDVVPEFTEVVLALHDTVQRLQVLNAIGRSKLLDNAALVRAEKALEAITKRLSDNEQR